MSEQYYTKGELSKKLSKLNACYGIAFQWQFRRAQKEHTDLFGKKIAERRHYFRLKMGGNYSNDLKLSYESMDRFLFAIFAPYPIWENDADKNINDRLQEARRIIDSLRP